MKFTINGKEYKSVELEFDSMCSLEELGISIDEIPKKHLSFLRVYFMLCSGLNKEDANRELQSHFVNGGTLKELTEVVMKEQENSDFFQAMAKNAEEKETESNQEKTKDH